MHLATEYGIKITQHGTLKSRIAFWSSVKWQNDTVNSFWSRTPAAVLWLQRNRTVFKNHKADWQETFMAALLRIRFWGQMGAAQQVSGRLDAGLEKSYRTTKYH